MEKRKPAAQGDTLPGIAVEEPRKSKSSKPLEFSYSRMSMYLECPLKYRFRYVEKIPEKPKSYFAFGHSIHSSLEFLYNVKQPPFPSMEEVLRAFEADWNRTAWSEKGYLKEEYALKDFENGRKMLSAYYKKHSGSFAVPLAVEFKSRLEIDRIAVTSIVDRIDYLGSGTIVIVDYKTGRTRSHDPAQLLMYQKICELSPVIKEAIKTMEPSFDGDVRVERLVFYHVPSLQEDSFGRNGDEEIKKFWGVVLRVAEGIEAKNFEPNPGEKQCKYCDYKHLCPVFAGGVSDVEADGKITASTAGMEELACLIDEYGDLKEKLKHAEVEAEELKLKIISLMKQNKQGLHQGIRYEAQWEQEEKWNFKDREGVITCLKEIGLYEKILGPSRDKLVKLLTDASVPEHGRERLKSLGEKTVHFILHCNKIEK